ncbi:hypothetical protein U4V41_21415, partial [Escherichia coli]|nr:hypothetical protein [Escherichia coli]
MSENDIIIRTHYESPLRMHIDSDILTPSSEPIREGANKQVISSQADSLIKISRIWAD